MPCPPFPRPCSIEVLGSWGPVSGLPARSRHSLLRRTLQRSGHRRKRVFFDKKAEPTIRRLGGRASWAGKSGNIPWRYRNSYPAGLPGVLPPTQVLPDPWPGFYGSSLSLLTLNASESLSSVFWAAHLIPRQTWTGQLGVHTCWLCVRCVSESRPPCGRGSGTSRAPCDLWRPRSPSRSYQARHTELLLYTPFKTWNLEVMSPKFLLLQGWWQSSCKKCSAFHQSHLQHWRQEVTLAWLAPVISSEVLVWTMNTWMERGEVWGLPEYMALGNYEVLSIACLKGDSLFFCLGSSEVAK